MKRVIVLAAAALVSAAAPTAWGDETARRPLRYGLVVAELRAGHARAVQSSAMAPTDVGGVGFAARGVYGGKVGFGFGADLALGVTSGPGALYDVTLYPAGVGLVVGQTGLVGVFAGAGVDGAVARVPFAVRAPVDARLELDAGSRVRLLFDAFVAWTPWTEARRHGATHVSFADEAGAGAGLRLGRLWAHYDYRSSGGYFLRVEYREALGAPYLGLAFGYELAASA